MRKLSTFQSIIMSAGALLMVAGIFMTVIGIGNIATYTIRCIAAISFTIGSIIFAVMQLLQTYNGNSITIRRLRRIMVFGAICMIMSGLLMIEQTFHIILPLFATSIDGYNSYYHYVHNNWGVMLLISCIVELYVTFRLSNELKKEVQ